MININKALIVFLLLLTTLIILIPAHTGFAAGEAWQDVENASYGRTNIFLQTQDITLKVGVFVVGIIALYLLSLFLFKRLIGRDKSPAKMFTFTFSLFMFLLFFLAFLCFSEYTISQEYDASILLSEYLSYLNWVVIILSFIVWGIVTLILTAYLRGNPAK